MSKKPWLGSLSAICAFGMIISGSGAESLTVDTSKLPPPSDKKGLSFEADVKPILEKSCVKCHSGARPKGKYLMETAESVVKGGISGEPAVVPGSSEKSPLVQFSSDAVVDMEMPPIDNRDKYPPLTKEQIGILRAWIDQGAK